MEIAMLIGSSMMGSTAAAAGSSILWAPAGMTVAQAAAAGIPLAASGAAAGGGILSALSTGLTFASMASDLFGGIMGGEAQSDSLKMEARAATIDAKQEEIRGKQEANDIMENMLRTVAEQRLAFAGGGIDSGFGTPLALAENMRNLSERQLDTSRFNTVMGVLSRRRAAANALSQRSGAMMGSVMQGVGSAGKTFTNYVAGRQNRG